ncbi:unnamed protein product [Candidula unifasciata]|uniref:F-box domain-containing protein n=1 Tax=Candidula unifasciata TaxID=100452 RepID=A0A8S3YJ05_9EUPU|nr:unnamed protein product [Candidula unifasciata]
MYLESQIAKTTIEKLPENIMLQIMQYLPMKDRCRVRRVNKTWNRIIFDQSLWRHVDLLDYYLPLKTLWKIFRIYLSPCLLTLKMQGIVYAENSTREKSSLSEALLQELSARCPKLRLLHVQKCKISSISFEWLPSSITCLEMVDAFWQPRWMKDKQKHLPKLEHLTLDNSEMVSDCDLEDVAVWKDLKLLSLKGCERVGTAGVITISKHLSELEFLNISSTDIREVAVHYIAQHLKKLKELILARCTSVTDRAVAIIAAGLPVLNKLDISFCEFVTMRGLEPLFVNKQAVLILNA